MSAVISEQRRMQAFESLGSNRHPYSRLFPAGFSRARGSTRLKEGGRKIIDFLSSAGTLNCGRNNHEIKAAVTGYVASAAVVYGLDMATLQSSVYENCQLCHTSGAGSFISLPIHGADRC